MNRVRLYCIALALGSIAMAGRMQSPATEVVLYNGAAGGLPASQGHFTYADPGGQATQSFSNGVTTFDTTASNSISAGYGYTGATDGLTFDRAAGYTVRVTVQIMSEQHANPDRAGFSMIALSSDHRGIELGFWADQIWAQNYDATAQFTHGETVSFDTTAALTTYNLTILGDTYTLRNGATVLLTGSLRDYSGFCSNNPTPYCPYGVPNFLFMGDDTSSAQATIRLSFASLMPGPPDVPTPTPQSINLYLPALMKAP